MLETANRKGRKMPVGRGPSRTGESAPEFVVTEAMARMPIGRVRQDA